MSVLDGLFDWQPIETVPSDGTPALVRIGNKIFAVATFSAIARNSRFKAWAPLDVRALEIEACRPGASFGSKQSGWGVSDHRADFDAPAKQGRAEANRMPGPKD